MSTGKPGILRHALGVANPRAICPAPLPRWMPLVKDVPADDFITKAAPYITVDQLADDAMKLARRLMAWPITRVVGVPRSGMIAASTIAVALGVKLCSIHEGKIVDMGSGLRLRDKRDTSGITLVVEDSTASGYSLKEVAPVFEGIPDVKYAAVYTVPSGTKRLDAWGKILPLPHWFEWNLWGNPDLHKGFAIATDMDGVLCEDCPIPADDDSFRYDAWLQSVLPLIKPAVVLHGIITARMAKYRPQTEAWLQRYGIRYKHLVMGPWKSLEERSRSCIGTWKREKCEEIGARLFVESDWTQTQVISSQWPHAVICPIEKTALVRGERPKWDARLKKQWNR